MKKYWVICTAVLVGAFFINAYVLSAIDSHTVNLPKATPYNTLPENFPPEGTDVITSELPPRVFSPSVFVSIPYWDQKAAYESFRENINTIDYISLFWYNLSPEGSIEKYTYATEDTAIIDFAHEHGVKVFALIANLPEEDGSDWDFGRVNVVIEESVARKKHINDIIALVDKHDFDGINIDYEVLRNKQRDNFTLFIEELGSALRARGKLLMVAVESRDSESDNAYGKDWYALSRSADMLAIMSYNEHWNESEPGPISSIDWFYKVYAFAEEKGVPKEKIYAGIPTYAYDWKESQKGSARELEYEDVLKIMYAHGASPIFDGADGSPFITYEDRGESHIVWYENAESFEKKFQAVKNLGLGGIAIWRIGREDTDMWKILE